MIAWLNFLYKKKAPLQTCSQLYFSLLFKNGLMDKEKNNFSKNLPYLIILVLVIVLLAIGYLHLTGKNTNSTTGQTNSAGSNNGYGPGRFGGGSGGRGNFQMVQGTIQSISGTTIVITVSDGTTKTITTDSSTRFMDFENGQRTTTSLSSLTTGEAINVPTSDSSQTTIAAKMIFIGTPSWGSQSQNNSSSGGTTNSD
jgi:hypothetical protein